MSELNTPIDDFIKHKTNTNMQCGNYSIDIPELKEGEQYRFHFDLSACVGCHCCEAACNEQNSNSADVKWRRVGELEGGIFPNTSQIFNSMSCNHCIDPECLNGCPTESYIKLDNGIVFHEDETCIGCSYCTWNCPYEVPVMNYDRGIVTKCHMCVDKLEVGETPACVQACPAGAIEIEVVNKEEWLKNDMKEQGVAPHLPDVNITKPTTRYTLPKNMSNDYKPANDHIIAPSHSELPLVFMTILTQMSVGGFFALFLGELSSLLGFSNLANANYILVMLIMLPALIGLPLSALHLGRPLLAYTAMKNWRNSWLSKEALALAIYAVLGLLVVALYYLEITSAIINIFIALTLISGIYGIHAQAMIYRIKARPSWDRISTNKKFLSSSYLGFLLVSLILSLQGFTNSSIVVLSMTLLISAYQLLTIYEEKNFYTHLKEDENNFYQLNKTKYLLENNFKKHIKIRFTTIVISSLILPLLAILFLANGNTILASIILSVSFIVSSFSELIGRYLFYVSTVSLGLAGNFFAGNQRGKDYKGGSHV